MVDCFFLHPLLLFFHLLSVSLITYLILCVLKIVRNTCRTTAVNAPPGSTGLPLIGETLAFIVANNSSKGFYDFVRTRHVRYGNCFKTSIFGDTHVFMSSPEAAKVILGCDSIGFSKRYIRSTAELLGDQSMLCASHDHHSLLRRKISTLFTLDSMASTIRMFDEMTVKTLRHWGQQENVVVFNDALKITFNAMCKMLISLEEEDELEILRKNVSAVSEAMLAFPLKLPGTRFYRGLKARKRIMCMLRKKIASRRKGLEHHEDFLQYLLGGDESLCGDPLPDKQILDNILTLIIAGQITTASALAWMIKYLDENEEVQDILRASQSELAPKSSGSSLELEDLNQMSYASKIVKESLRMSSIVSWFPRVALKDCQIEGFQIRKGWIVDVDVRSIHFDPMVYNNPTKFNPLRFDEDPKPYSFLAFGTGARTCLGMNLAKAMLLAFLHRLVTTYRWKVTDADTSLEKWAMFPRLRSGCPIRVTPVETGPKLPRS